MPPSESPNCSLARKMSAFLSSRLRQLCSQRLISGELDNQRIVKDGFAIPCAEPRGADPKARCPDARLGTSSWERWSRQPELLAKESRKGFCRRLSRPGSRAMAILPRSSPLKCVPLWLLCHSAGWPWNGANFLSGRPASGQYFCLALRYWVGAVLRSSSPGLLQCDRRVSKLASRTRSTFW